MVGSDENFLLNWPISESVTSKADFYSVWSIQQDLLFTSWADLPQHRTLGGGRRSTSILWGQKTSINWRVGKFYILPHLLSGNPTYILCCSFIPIFNFAVSGDMLVLRRVSSWGNIFFWWMQTFCGTKEELWRGSMCSIDIEINKGFYYVHNCVYNIVYVKNNVSSWFF